MKWAIQSNAEYTGCQTTCFNKVCFLVVFAFEREQIWATLRQRKKQRGKSVSHWFLPISKGSDLCYFCLSAGNMIQNNTTRPTCRSCDDNVVPLDDLSVPRAAKQPELRRDWYAETLFLKFPFSQVMREQNSILPRATWAKCNSSRDEDKVCLGGPRSHGSPVSCANSTVQNLSGPDAHRTR